MIALLHYKWLISKDLQSEVKSDSKSYQIKNVNKEKNATAIIVPLNGSTQLLLPLSEGPTNNNFGSFTGYLSQMRLE